VGKGALYEAFGVLGNLNLIVKQVPVSLLEGSRGFDLHTDSSIIFAKNYGAIQTAYGNNRYRRHPRISS